MPEPKFQPHLFIIVILIMLASAMGKIHINAMAELQQAKALAGSEKQSEAVTHYERAIHWYLPGTGGQDRAAEGLWKIAGQYESDGDLENAINSYRLLRGAFYATRSFYTPGQRWIDLCNGKISHIMALQQPYSESDKTKSFEQRKADALARLTAEKPPYVRWALLGEAGFYGWLACAFMFIARALTPSGKILANQALFWGCGIVLFYALWLLGLGNI
jgi:hypothetical protein